MQSSESLKERLREINKKGYPSYKSLKGNYQFPNFILNIDHVQGDPFASPSNLSIEISMEKAGFDRHMYDSSCKRIALQDELLRGFSKCLGQYSFQAKGSGKSGFLGTGHITSQVLERTALMIKHDCIEARLEAGFPANGRTVNAGELERMLFVFLPEIVRRSFLYKNLDENRIQKVLELSQDQEAIRTYLKENRLVAFVGNGAILPRKSGISDLPMNDAVLFESPKSLEVEINLPFKGVIKGMGIQKGITLIVGGGYHGKSTLLRALEQGVYNHILGDGREYVITENSAMKIRSEDGRAVSGVDISLFIEHLPDERNTKFFFTEDASGSTSQAANVVEAVQSDSKVLLIDEDTCATNFMVRDELMQKVISKEKEPITPFIDRARMLYEKKDVSTILVAGSSGSYFYIADHVIQMDCYKAIDITEKVKKLLPDKTIPQEEKEFSRGKRVLKIGKIERKHGQIRTKILGRDGILIGREKIDLSAVEQIVDAEQCTALAKLMEVFATKMDKENMGEVYTITDGLCRKIENGGMEAFEKLTGSKGFSAFVRRQEIYACVNRFRGFLKK